MATKLDNKEYWDKFYKEKKAPTKQTKFAEFVEAYFIDELREKKLKIIDLGAGNGRDTKWLNKSSFFIAYGIDESFSNDVIRMVSKNEYDGKVIKCSIKKLINKSKKPTIDMVYSRFFLHSITNKEIIDILKWTPKYFVAEFRLKGDEPIVYKNHDRNLVDLSWFVKQLELNGFEILFLKTGYGMAKYKNEDPYVCRVVAKK